MNSVLAGCWHCGEPLPASDVPQAIVAGDAHAVCCQGCRAAAEWIDQLGLADYYRLRSAPAPRATFAADSSAASASVWTRPELARHIVRDLGGERREAMVLIEGLRCSACVWLIERALGAQPGIVAVQLNAAARRARLVWDASNIDLARIVTVLAQAGYRARPLDAQALDDARGRESRDALKHLAVAGFGAMQAMMYASALYFGAFDAAGHATRDAFRWLGVLVATPVVFYAAHPFFHGAARALAARRLGIDVPVALAIALIYAASVFETIRGGSEVYFESVSMFVFFLLIGRYLEMRARHRSGDLTDALARLTPLFADRIRADGTHERIGALELLCGDRVHIAEGAVVPADGTLLSARCRVDEALLSGESTPVVKCRGDRLVAGGILAQGPAQMQIEQVGADTLLAGIVALATRAATERPRLAQSGERAAAGFVARVLLLATLTAIGWSLVDPSRAFAATLAVLVVSCPCAFALAVPAALTRAIAVLARHGVLVARPDAIENLARATHFVFDKTGTLTDARLTLERVTCVREGDGARALSLAGALARGSRHPVALALAAAAGNSTSHEVADLHATAGDGIEGTVDGVRLRLGRADFALAHVASSPAFDDTVVLADASGAIATFALSETVRPGARHLIDRLRAAGVGIEIVSGDITNKVADVAARLGIGDWRARQRPADKLARLVELRASGARVVAVGDGINDAPVLGGADVAVALAGGAEIAQASSDIVLVGERIGALADAREIARDALAILRQNQRWALAYNLSIVPLAAFGFVPPWLAALGMSTSSLIVVLNALRIGSRKTAADRVLHVRAPA